MWAGIDRCASAPPHRARSKQIALRVRRSTMHVIKVLLLFAAITCIIRARVPPSDENKTTKEGRSKAREKPNPKDVIPLPENGRRNRLTKYDKAVRINTRPESKVETSVSPLTTTRPTKIPTSLYNMLMGINMSPDHAGDNYVHAQKSSTTPDTYLDTDDQTGVMELERAMDAGTSSNIKETFYEDPVQNERKSVDDTALAGRRDYVEPIRAQVTFLGIDEQGTAIFAAKADTDGFYQYGNEPEENMTEFWLLEEVPMRKNRITRKGNKEDGRNEIGHLRAGLTMRRIRIPNRLANLLSWIEIVTEDDSTTTIQEGSTEKMKYPGRISQIYENDNNNDSLYSLTLLVAICAALTMAIIGLVFGWSALQKQARAAAEVDYPAYGVTGPTVATGDRRLAHTAQIYHYQHHKQQIISLDNTVMEARAGSVSDNESDDNDEGEYTVYECPGLATTGDMEVKNPMFNDEPTPGVSADVAVTIEE